MEMITENMEVYKNNIINRKRKINIVFLKNIPTRSSLLKGVENEHTFYKIKKK